MKKTEEILRKHLTDDHYDAWDKQWHLDNCPMDAPMTTVVDVIQAAMEEYAQEVVKNLNIPAVINCVPYQLCPKCGGQGTVSKPPYVAGDVHEWSSTSCSFTCDVCEGKKIIPMAHCL